MSSRRITIPVEELKKIPYLNHDNMYGRMVPQVSFLDKGKWRFWFFGHNQIMEAREGAIPVEADYFSLEPESKTDLFLDFLNFMTQRAYWPETGDYLNGIRSDIHNLAASLAKLEHFYTTSMEVPGIRRWATTEIEYIFFVCRSLFDLLQKTIATMWNRVEFKDKNTKKHQLPHSFSTMSLFDRKLLTAEEIVERHNIPLALAQFYYRQGPFFQMLKRYRDDLIHYGKDVKWLFATKRGFAIQDDAVPFRDFGIWNDEHKQPNGLASARPIIAHVIDQTLHACEDFSGTIQQIIMFPPEIVPGYNLYIRGFHTCYLLDIERIQSNCLWWDE